MCEYDTKGMMVREMVREKPSGRKPEVSSGRMRRSIPRVSRKQHLGHAGPTASGRFLTGHDLSLPVSF